MKFGLLYEIQAPTPSGARTESEAFHEAIEQIVLAEAMGFDYVWAVEHHFLTEFSYSCAPEVWLAAVAGKTSRIRLGPGVVLLPVNHPIRVAEYMATLDIVSHGRVELATGRSPTHYQLEPFGVELKDSRPMWRESLELILKMWAQKVFPGYEGKYWKIPPREILPKPAQKPHPPLWTAASQPATYHLAGKLGLGVLSFALMGSDGIEQRNEIYREAIKTAEPLSPAGMVNEQFAAFTVAFCHENRQYAREVGGKGAEWFFTNARDRLLAAREQVDLGTIPEDYRYHYFDRFKEARFQFVADKVHGNTIDELIDTGSACTGTPDDCIRTIEKYEAMGVDQFMSCMQAGYTSHKDIMQSLELFGRYVIPHFQKKATKVGV